MSTISKRLFTAKEFQEMAETGILSEDDRLELTQGEIVEMSPIGTRHAAAVNHCAKLLVIGAGDRAVVRVQTDVVFDSLNQPQPDLVIARPSDDFYAAKHPEPQDILLIVEVADTSLEYDQTVKQELYAKTGVPEYWIADLRNNVLLAYSDPQGTTYVNVRTFGRGESVAPLLLSCCRIPVAVLVP